MDPGDTILLGTAYFGPVQYFSKFLLSGDIRIEQFDHYLKQTYRNRCNIAGANGILPLTVPVLKGPDHKSYVKDIRIDYSKDWRKLHWKSIESAYMHSPFFEFYMDEIRDFTERKHEFLLDLNMEILEFLLESLEIDANLKLSESYENQGNFRDYRDLIHPKTDHSEDTEFIPEPYMQVFSDRWGFQSNLSVMDLIFNEGPNSPMVLRKCIAR